MEVLDCLCFGNAFTSQHIAFSRSEYCSTTKMCLLMGSQVHLPQRLMCLLSAHIFQLNSVYMQNNPNIIKWMGIQNPSIKNMSALEEYFERRVLDLAAAAGRLYIVWQEILDNNVQASAIWPFSNAALHFMDHLPCSRLLVKC